MTVQTAGTLYHKDIATLSENTSHHKLISRVPEKCFVLDVGCACGDLRRLPEEI